MSTYRIPKINNIPPVMADPAFHADMRFDPSDAAPDYVGLHDTVNASTANTNWKIYKFTYSGNSTTRIQLSYGAWDDRVDLF